MRRCRQTGLADTIMYKVGRPLTYCSQDELAGAKHLIILTSYIVLCLRSLLLSIEAGYIPDTGNWMIRPSLSDYNVLYRDS